MLAVQPAHCPSQVISILTFSRDAEVSGPKVVPGIAAGIARNGDRGDGTEAVVQIGGQSGLSIQAINVGDGTCDAGEIVETAKIPEREGHDYARTEGVCFVQS